MEYDKINNLLLCEDNESEKLSKFVTRVKKYNRIMEETQEIIIPPEKTEQIIRDLKLF